MSLAPPDPRHRGGNLAFVRYLSKLDTGLCELRHFAPVGQHHSSLSLARTQQGQPGTVTAWPGSADEHNSLTQ